MSLFYSYSSIYLNILFYLSFLLFPPFIVFPKIDLNMLLFKHINKISSLTHLIYYYLQILLNFRHKY